MTTFQTRGAAAPQHRRSFHEAIVADAMHPGVLTCPPETSLITVARMMAAYGVHAIVVTAPDAESESSERGWAVVSDLDVTKAASIGHEDATAGGMAQTELVTVAPHEPLSRATELLAEHEVSHLVVADSEADRPVGVISTLDVAAALAVQP